MKITIKMKNVKKTRRHPATTNLHMIKNRQETDTCPTRECCVELWGDEETFCHIRDLTKFELIYKQDEFIYKTNDPVTSLYVIQSGAIKLEKEVEGGDNHISGFYFTGDLVGLESLGHKQYHYNAIALNETWVCEIRLQKLATLGKSALTIQQRINTLLSRKLCEIDEHLYSTRHLHIEQRLLDFLNVLCTKNIDHAGDSPDRFVLPMAKADIANYLGMRPESLSRAFRQLQSRGIIKDRLKRKTIVINKQKLLSGVMKKSA